MPYIMNIPVTAENFQNMGCVGPDADVDSYNVDELIEGRYAPCIGPECSQWDMAHPDNCKYMEGAYIHNMKQQALKGIFMSAVK